MLDRLEQQPPDALLALIKLHDADPRADKGHARRFARARLTANPIRPAAHSLPLQA
jgi:hypothetical protein